MSDDARPLPAPAPAVSPEAKPYWDAAAEGRLLLQRCADCEAVIWYPRGFCPACSGSRLDWFEASGRGTVYSFTVVRRGAMGLYAGTEPYVLAYVELDEGPRVMTNVVDCDPDAVSVGDAVSAVFHDTGEGSALVRFRPA
jgi:uncharacterized OB-fold protein